MQVVLWVMIQELELPCMLMVNIDEPVRSCLQSWCCVTISHIHMMMNKVIFLVKPQLTHAHYTKLDTLLSLSACIMQIRA